MSGPIAPSGLDVILRRFDQPDETRRFPKGRFDVVTIAGPCSVESEQQILEAARQVKEAGATILRGGAWKPRSSRAVRWSISVWC